MGTRAMVRSESLEAGRPRPLTSHSRPLSRSGRTRRSPKLRSRLATIEDTIVCTSTGRPPMRASEERMRSVTLDAETASDRAEKNPRK